MAQSPLTALAPIIISVFALLVASLSMIISYLGYRRNVNAEEPTASATVEPLPGHKDWFKVLITIVNRRPHGYQLEAIIFKRPRSARALRYWGAHEQYAGKSVMRAPLPKEDAKKILRMSVELTKAGIAAPTFHQIRMGQGEDHKETLFVFARRSILSRTLSMRVILRSIEPIERKTEIAIKRTLPHAANTVNA